MNDRSIISADPKGAERASFQDLRLVARSLAGATTIALALVALYGWSQVGKDLTLPLLWAVGIWSAGVLLGFLFGIPKVLQGVQPAASPAPPGTVTAGPSSQPVAASSSAIYQQRVNTNLEEISDWLTKIIVGVTLVQLKELPPQFSRLATHIVAGFKDGNNNGFGLAIVLAFSTLGFLFGYLLTRLYIQGALARAERGVVNEGFADAEQQRVLAEVASAMLTHATKTIEANVPASAASADGGPPASVRQELERLAKEYKDVRIVDLRERTTAKTDLAAKLFAYALEQGVSRDWLAGQGDEVMALALAGVVQAAPTLQDAARLLRSAPRITRKHVQYWIVLALSRLIERNLVTEDERREIQSLLDLYDKTADDALRSLINRVRGQIK